MKTGDAVLCKGWDRGTVTRHVILAVREERNCQSGTVLQVRPKLRLREESTWIDSAWFVLDDGLGL